MLEVDATHTREQIDSVRRVSELHDAVRLEEIFGRETDAPTTRYSTPREFINSMNSRKSFCSFTERSVVTEDDFEEQIEAFLGSQRVVVPRVLGIRLFEGIEHSRDPVHGRTLARR
jgi:hypothetical protein